jgi:hypothetical protein
VEAPAFTAGVECFLFRFCALALVVAGQDFLYALRMRKGNPPGTATGQRARGYQKYNRDASRNLPHRGCDGSQVWAARLRSAPARAEPRSHTRLCNDEMKMIGHDYELVEFESSFAAIEIERVNQQFGGVCILEKYVPPVRHGCDEKSSYLLRSMGHV